MLALSTSHVSCNDMATLSPGDAELAAQEIHLKLGERGLSWKMRLRWAQTLAKL